jgi:hypothetical protein
MQPPGAQCPGLGAELLISYRAAIYSTGVYIAIELHVIGCNLLEFSTLTLGAEPLSVAGTYLLEISTPASIARQLVTNYQYK